MGEIKNLLTEIERARNQSVKEWMENQIDDDDEALARMGEVSAFDFVIHRLKSILRAMENES